MVRGGNAFNIILFLTAAACKILKSRKLFDPNDLVTCHKIKNKILLTLQIKY